MRRGGTRIVCTSTHQTSAIGTILGERTGHVSTCGVSLWTDAVEFSRQTHTSARANSRTVLLPISPGRWCEVFEPLWESHPVSTQAQQLRDDPFSIKISRFSLSGSAEFVGAYVPSSNSLFLRRPALQMKMSRLRCSRLPNSRNKLEMPYFRLTTQRGQVRPLSNDAVGFAIVKQPSFLRPPRRRIPLGYDRKFLGDVWYWKLPPIIANCFSPSLSCDDGGPHTTSSTT